MASDQHSPPDSPAGTAQAFLSQYHFLLRRLHSLSGILPVGVFVIMHLFTNFQMIMGTDAHGQSHFQHEVDFIHSTPGLLFVEITLWASIAFHAGLGLVYTFGGKPNTRQYPYTDNWRYTLQRTTGIIALIFIFLHIATLRWRWDLFGWFTPFYVYGVDAHGQKIPLAHATTAMALQSTPVLVLYVIGALSVVYHWCNGLWTAAITWGLTISTAAQRRWGYACVALGVALTVFTAGAIVGARCYEVTPAEKAAYEAMAGQAATGHADGQAPGTNTHAFFFPDSDASQHTQAQPEPIDSH